MPTKVKSYKIIFDDSPKDGSSTQLVEIAELENNPRKLKRGLHILIKENRYVKTKKYGFTFYTPSYKGIRAIIDGMVEIYGKEEVERELGIKIGGNEK